MSEQERVSLEDHLFELPGTPQAWLWVHTCPRPRCECRSALVLASDAGREMLIERGAFIHAAQGAGANCNHAAALLEDVLVFSLDIDTAEILSTADQELLDLSHYPEIADVAHRIDGDVLEWIGRLWYRGKGELDPEQRVLQTDRINVRGWQFGNLLAWNDLCTGVRRDLYVIDGALYEADELYCPVPDCKCGEVLVDFELRGTDKVTPVGGVKVRRSGEVELVATPRCSSDLQRLWAAYCRRHPRYAERIERRDAIVKRIGARFVPKGSPSRRPGKVGRNDACPCGSGRKFKKCCGSASAIRGG